MDIESLENKNFSESIAIWSLTPNGKNLGKKIRDSFKDSRLFVSARVWGTDPLEKNTITFDKLSKEIQAQFNRFSGHVFLFSTGIAVRMIAPLLESKIKDPGVVVVDDNANHAISLLSGHLGGANALTLKVAAAIDARPVITTATDTNLLPSIDMIAKQNNLYIETPQNIKLINMAFLMGQKIELYDPFECIKKDLPKTIWFDPATPVPSHPVPPHTASPRPGHSTAHQIAPKVFCSYVVKDVSRETLVLRPPILSVGIGCNRGTSHKEIKAFLSLVLEKEGLSRHSIFRFATTMVKADEEGLLTLSKEMDIQMDFYDKDQLNSVTTIETPSKMVEKHLGVKSVCEAASILSADNGKLIVPKKKNKDVTIAVAIKK